MTLALDKTVIEKRGDLLWVFETIVAHGFWAGQHIMKKMDNKKETTLTICSQHYIKLQEMK